MTEQEKQALSQALATKYGVGARFEYPENIEGCGTWLADDWARLMPLAVKHGVYGIGIMSNGQNDEWAEVKYNTYDYLDQLKINIVQTELPIYPTKEEAVRIAICRALLEK